MAIVNVEEQKADIYYSLGQFDRFLGAYSIDCHAVVSATFIIFVSDLYTVCLNESKININKGTTKLRISI